MWQKRLGSWHSKSWPCPSIWHLRDCRYSRISFGVVSQKMFDRTWVSWNYWWGWNLWYLLRSAPCILHCANWRINLSELQFEAELLWLSGRADFANGVAFGRNCWCSWSLYKRRIRSMWTAVMLCFILLKSGNYAIIVRHYALIISFVIGFELVTNFAMGRFSGVSWGRLGELGREISMKA